MIRALLVDDERLARVELRRLLGVHADVEIVGEADNAATALELVGEHQPDVVFLDIQMPETTGLALAAELAGRTRFVFCSAYDSYAVDAFGLNAVDYLVKPVVPERLADTLDRLRQHAPSSAVLPYDHGLLLRFGEQARIVRLREIDRFESIGNQARVHCAHGRSWLQASLNRIEQRLDPKWFFRVSRSDILRLDAIVSIEPDVGTGSIATLPDGSQVGVSRRQAQALKQRMGQIL